MKKLVIFFFLLLSCIQIQALTLTELSLQLKQTTTLRAEFEQSRKIASMSKPLLSNGTVLIAQDYGLLWQQQKPFSMSVLMTEKRMVQKLSGQTPQIITAASNPQMFQFNKLLSALFRADVTVLEQNFNLDLKDLGKQGWTLRLKPKTAPLNKIFRSFYLKGDRYLNTIEIYDTQGDSSNIRFFNHKTQPLNNEEIRNFSS